MNTVPHRNRPQSLLEVSHLTKTYDGHAALDDLNLRVEVGHLVALVGHNGAGKSTLLGCVDDWQTPGRALVKMFELLDRADDLPSRFSRGMRQKVALAVALVRAAPLVVIDEPFVGLDMKAQAALTETLVARARSGSTIIVATHQPLFLSHADWCVMLVDGRLHYDGPPNDEVLDALQKGE